MITKKPAIFFIFLICAIGSWLFYLKYSVVSIEDRIRRAKKEIINESKNQHILKAEWKSLTSPDRVQKLALKYLKLKQIAVNQLKEYDPSIFHTDRNKYQKTKKLSQLINEIISRKETD